MEDEQQADPPSPTARGALRDERVDASAPAGPRLDARSVPFCSFELPATPLSVRRARHWVLAFTEEHSADRDLHVRVALAFTEAFTNAVRHAFAGADARCDDIRVSADVDDGTLEIVVVDRGPGIRAGSAASGLGAGLSIIAVCADEFAIRERTREGTEVWMAFLLADAQTASGSEDVATLEQDGPGDREG